jgi:hypothetical protein
MLSVNTDIATQQPGASQTSAIYQPSCAASLAHTLDRCYSFNLDEKIWTIQAGNFHQCYGWGGRWRDRR